MTTVIRSRFSNVVARLRSGRSLTQKASLNSLATALDYGARTLTKFIITPFLVGGLGDFLYGIWLILGRVTGSVEAAGGRSSQALKWVIASEQSSTDYEAKRRHVGGALIVWLLFLPLLTGLGAVVAWYAPLWIRNVPPELHGVVRVAAGLLVARSIVATLVRIPQSVLEGENLGYKRMGLSAAIICVGGGFTWLALYLNTGLVGVAVANLATVLLTGPFYLLLVRAYVDWFGVLRTSARAVRRFFGLSGWFIVWRLVTRVLMASDVVILGVLASAELATIYSLTKYAPDVLVKVAAIGLFGITPGLGGIIGAGDFEKARQVRAELMRFSWLSVTAIGSTILMWNQAFLALWLGPGRYAGTLPNLLILLMIAQFILIRIDANIIDLTLQLSRKVLIGLVSVSLSIVAAGILVATFETGISGLLLGLIAGRSILSVSYPLMIGRVLGSSLFDQVKASLRPLLVSALVFTLASWGKHILDNGAWYHRLGWLEFVPAIVATVATATFAAFFLGLSADDRERLRERVRIAISPHAT